MSLLIFSHGNSFPASTYGVMLASLKKRGFTVKCIEKFGHDARYPVTNNWPHLVQQLAEFVQPLVEKSGEKAWLVGHSLGGILSTMCAARHPELARGIVLLDSPVIGGWKATALGAAKVSGIVGSISPGKISQRRTQTWASEEAAYNSFKSKRAFALWEDEVLRDYIAHGTFTGEDGKRHLSFDRAVETQIYNTLPDILPSLLRRKPLQCPAAFIGGLQSAELKQTGTDLTSKFTQGRMSWIDGTHLFPMEKPLATAALVEGAIKAMG
ncbi:alpha/beta hydrolase [Variovorax sp. PCZ-1]|uniref:alpha/beta fold hydrolase n=1 Tax=Variovorax sp. PCZ-1 TaxID=2835533 RepID=UPI001BCB18A5|nr:alpha/beta hydrolase [Variovorax sp. PCZ-1]MBS7807091.1 alpha/beta hydrolase [Variovorax sp. PCZ-1]